jgi:hypothetical protein
VGEIGLGEAIRALRAELTEAKGEGDRSWLRFGVGPVELELQAVVTKDASGKVGWKVVEVGGAVGKETTQKVTLTLTPQWWDAGRQQYTSDFLVAGELGPAGPGPSDPSDPSGDDDALPRTDTDPDPE